jgi:YcaO-like protein with predicted kinase domain
MSKGIEGIAMKLFGHELGLEKSFLNGTHRAISPADTVKRYTPLMSEVGITRLANVTGLDCIGIPVYVSIRPNSRSVSVSQGKGLSADAAKASALMESIELWHAERVTVPQRLEAYSWLSRRERVVDVERLSRRPGVELAPDKPIMWALGYDIVAQKETWAPFDMVTLNLVGDTYARSTFEMSSNGLASGNHVLEAIEHAFCELIERDSVTMWWLRDDATRKTFRIKLETIDDPGCREVLERFERADIQVAVWDVSSDAEIPTFMCAIADREGRAMWRTLGAFWGYGCHPSRAVALCRALTEAAQGRLTIIAGSRDDNFRTQYARQTNAHAFEQVRAKLLEGESMKSFQDRPDKTTSTFEGDIQALIDGAGKIGVDSVVVFDLTREDFKIPVVKLITPGLEGYLWHETYRPGERAKSRMEGQS